MREQDYQRKIVKLIEDRGGYVVKVISASKKGVPDIIACYGGLFLAIEVKTPRTMNNVSPLQQHNLNKVSASGGHSLVAWSVEAVSEVLDELDDAN